VSLGGRGSTSSPKEAPATAVIVSVDPEVSWTVVVTSLSPDTRLSNDASEGDLDIIILAPGRLRSASQVALKKTLSSATAASTSPKRTTGCRSIAAGTKLKQDKDIKASTKRATAVSTTRGNYLSPNNYTNTLNNGVANVQAETMKKNASTQLDATT
jgi:hypothetical protein